MVEQRVTAVLQQLMMAVIELLVLLLLLTGVDQCGHQVLVVDGPSKRTCGHGTCTTCSSAAAAAAAAACVPGLDGFDSSSMPAGLNPLQPVRLLCLL
jgi:hypothetical protein